MDFTLSPLTVEPYGNFAVHMVPGKRKLQKVLAITGPTPNGELVAYIFSLSDTSDEDFLKWQSSFKASLPTDQDVTIKRVKNVAIDRLHHVYNFYHQITKKLIHSSVMTWYYTPRQVEEILDEFNSSFDIDSAEYLRVVNSVNMKKGKSHA